MMKTTKWFKMVMMNTVLAGSIIVSYGATTTLAGPPDCDDPASLMSEEMEQECNKHSQATRVKPSDDRTSIDTEMAEGIGYPEENLKKGDAIAKHDHSAPDLEEELDEGITYKEIRARRATETMPAAGK